MKMVRTVGALPLTMDIFKGKIHVLATEEGAPILECALEFWQESALWPMAQQVRSKHIPVWNFPYSSSFHCLDAPFPFHWQHNSFWSLLGCNFAESLQVADISRRDQRKQTFWKATLCGLAKETSYVLRLWKAVVQLETKAIQET